MSIEQQMKKFLFFLIIVGLKLPVTAQSIQLEIRAYAQGFYSPSLMEMVPVVDPINHPTLCDTATIVLIDSSSGQSIYCDRVAFSTRGYGISTLPNGFLGTSYLIGVRFRNTLHVVSLNKLLLDSTSKSIDLTIPSNLCCAFDSTYGVASAYSGDVNRDGTVDVTDIIIIDNDQSLGVTGYVLTDLTGDGLVDNDDANIASDNNALLLYDSYSGLCLPTGLSDTENSTLHAIAYPNPFSEKITIRLAKDYPQVKLVLSDALGKILYSGNFSSQSSLTIETADLASGIYYVHILADEKKLVLKLFAF